MALTAMMSWLLSTKRQGSRPCRSDPFSHFLVHPTYRSHQDPVLSMASRFTNSLGVHRPHPFSSSAMCAQVSDKVTDSRPVPR